MEQRPLRLGDHVDDYCPRERRLTNHAIVALVGEDIRQTRCMTCDAEHVYKGGKAPARKKKSPTEGLYEQVLANVTAGTVVATSPPAVTAPDHPPAPVAPLFAAPAASAPEPEPEAEREMTVVQESWSMHRTLIRATLPRTPELVATTRQAPEFTMHQRNVRGSQFFRSGGMESDRNHSANGNGHHHGRAHGNGHNHSPRDGAGNGQPAPNGQRPGGGGRRRRRHKKPRPTN